MPTRGTDVILKNIVSFILFEMSHIPIFISSYDITEIPFKRFKKILQEEYARMCISYGFPLRYRRDFFKILYHFKASEIVKYHVQRPRPPALSRSKNSFQNAIEFLTMFKYQGKLFQLFVKMLVNFVRQRVCLDHNLHLNCN